jgi:hypothetical protein
MPNSDNTGNGEQRDANRPAQTIRYGAIKATIWRNPTRNGTMYSTTVIRTFKGEDDEWRESHSFGPNELPTVAKLLLDAHSWIQDQLARERTEASEPELQQRQARRGRDREPARA